MCYSLIKFGAFSTDKTRVKSPHWLSIQRGGDHFAHGGKRKEAILEEQGRQNNKEGRLQGDDLSF